MEPRGIEPLSSQCECDVLPLYYGPNARHYFLDERLTETGSPIGAPRTVKLVGWVVRLSLLSGGVTYAADTAVCPQRHPSRLVFVAAVTAVLFYLYIFLSISAGLPLKETAPTFPLQRPALAFGTLGLLLICGVNVGDFSATPNHLLCRGEFPLALNGGTRGHIPPLGTKGTSMPA